VESALGALEGVVEGMTEAQEEARHAGVLQLLLPLLDRSKAPADLRDNSVLALRACVHGNAGAVQAATEAGLVQSLIAQLDDGPESEVALLAVQALLSLGLREMLAQEAAVKRTEGRGSVRVATLRRVWTRL